MCGSSTRKPQVAIVTANRRDLFLRDSERVTAFTIQAWVKNTRLVYITGWLPLIWYFLYTLTNILTAQDMMSSTISFYHGYLEAELQKFDGVEIIHIKLSTGL